MNGLESYLLRAILTLPRPKNFQQRQNHVFYKVFAQKRVLNRRFKHVGDQKPSKGIQNCAFVHTATLSVKILVPEHKSPKKDTKKRHVSCNEF